MNVGRYFDRPSHRSDDTSAEREQIENVRPDSSELKQLERILAGRNSRMFY